MQDWTIGVVRFRVIKNILPDRPAIEQPTQRRAKLVICGLPQTLPEAVANVL